MPSKEEHINRAKLNEEFGEKVLTLEKRFKPWAVVAFHYGALHWVDAYLATKNQHPMNHGIRNNWLWRDAILKQIYNQYHQLKSDSEDARYNIRSFKEAEVKQVKGYLSEIEAHIQNAI